jgi:SAM-dependent methyltransferase
MRPGWSSSGEQLEALVRTYLTPEARVMDLGCGRGGVIEVIWQDVDLAVGLDPDIPSLADHRAHGMPVLRGRGEHLPFASESFDLIVCLWVLEHLRSPELVLREVRRVLRPGGHFLFLTPNLRNPLLTLHRLGRGLPQLQRRLVPRLYGRIEGDTFPVQYRANTTRGLRSLAERSGLQVAELRVV